MQSCWDAPPLDFTNASIVLACAEALPHFGHGRDSKGLGPGPNFVFVSADPKQCLLTVFADPFWT